MEQTVQANPLYLDYRGGAVQQKLKGIKKADIPNRYIGNGYNIRLTFTKDEDTYVVSIDRKTSVKVKLEKNGEDISSHTATNTYKTIQTLLV